MCLRGEPLVRLLGCRVAGVSMRCMYVVLSTEPLIAFLGAGVNMFLLALWDSDLLTASISRCET